MISISSQQKSSTKLLSWFMKARYEGICHRDATSSLSLPILFQFYYCQLVDVEQKWPPSGRLQEFKSRISWFLMENWKEPLVLFLSYSLAHVIVRKRLNCHFLGADLGKEILRPLSLFATKTVTTTNNRWEARAWEKPCTSKIQVAKSR